MKPDPLYCLGCANKGTSSCPGPEKIERNVAVVNDVDEVQHKVPVWPSCHSLLGASV